MDNHDSFDELIVACAGGRCRDFAPITTHERSTHCFIAISFSFETPHDHSPVAKMSTYTYTSNNMSTTRAENPDGTIPSAASRNDREIGHQGASDGTSDGLEGDIDH